LNPISFIKANITHLEEHCKFSWWWFLEDGIFIFFTNKVSCCLLFLIVFFKSDFMNVKFFLRIIENSTII